MKRTTLFFLIGILSSIVVIGCGLAILASETTEAIQTFSGLIVLFGAISAGIIGALRTTMTQE